MQHATLTMLVCLTAANAAAGVFNGVSLKVRNETEPPGGTVQMKVFVTEPTPISTGGTKLMMDESVFSSIDGIGVFSSAADTYATAVVNGPAVSFRFVSSHGKFGLEPDYPVITVAARVRPDVALGTKTPLAVDARTLSFASPFGALYATETKDGQLTIAGGVSIGNVEPGSGVVPAGGVVAITGVNFTPGTDVRISEAAISNTKYVSPTRIEVTLASATEMHGRKIRASGDDGSKADYYSYQRTKPVTPSSKPLLARTVPVFPQKEWTTSTYAAAGQSATRWMAVALANLRTQPAMANVELLSVNGAVVRRATVTLAPNTRTARTLVELFGEVPAAAAVRVTSTHPLQSMAMLGDDGTSIVLPVPPFAAN